MSIQELIEIANMTTINWSNELEAEQLILNLSNDGYTEAEIEKILYLMDDGQTIEEAKKILND